MENTYIPQNRIGWWGSEDTRERCVFTDKVALSEETAIYKASKIQERGDNMTHYHCRECGNWHLGHKRGNY